MDGRSFETQGMNARRLEILMDAGLRISSESASSELLQMIVAASREVTNADAATLYVPDDKNERLVFEVMHNESMGVRLSRSSSTDDQLPESIPLYLDGKPNRQNVSAHAAITGESVNIPDVYAFDRFNLSGPKTYDEKTGYKTKSMLVLPLKDQNGKNIAVLQLTNARDWATGAAREFDGDDTKCSLLLASYAAQTVVRSSLIDALSNKVEVIKAMMHKEKELTTLSVTDALTGLSNRRRFDDFLEKELSIASATKSCVSMILMDVDFFKKYNDGYGHEAGDKCLQRVARSLAETIKRPGDLVARYGGEEFVVVLPDTNAVEAVKIAEKLREAVAAAAIPHKFSDVRECVTISLGVACVVPDAETTPSAMIKSADAALYEGKESGRNRVTLSKTLQA